MAIYDAQYELLIGDPYVVTPEEVLKGPIVSVTDKLNPPEARIEGADTERSGFKITEHNIKFTITKTKSGDSPNTMNLVIDNLPDLIVNYLANRTGKKTMVLLKAGFKSPGIDVIFVGNLESYKDDFNGPTRHTELLLADGGANYQETSTYRSYPVGTSVNSIVNDLISDTFLPKGGANVYPTDELTIKPLYFNGSVISQLIKLANMYKFNASVQDGAVFWTPAGKATETTVTHISPDTGLIGSVDQIDNTQGTSQNSPSKINKGVKFKCLLNPHILPETVLSLESSTVSGGYKVTKVIHTGSLEGNSWHSEVWAEEVQFI